MEEKKLVEEPQKKLYKLCQLLDNGLITLQDIADVIPGIMHVNARDDLALEFMSELGCNIIRYSNEELQNLGASVLEKHQSDYTLKVTYPKLFEELSKNDIDQVTTFFQDWQYSKGENPVFHYTSTKILNEKQTISISLFPRNIEYLSKKVNNMFGINTIFDNYFKLYQTLTKREKEIVKLLGRELTRKEISCLLFIDEKTVKKHCENIFKKLHTNKRTEIEKIAMAFSTI